MRRPSRRVSWALAFAVALGANAVIAYREWDFETEHSIRRAEVIGMGEWRDVDVSRDASSLLAPVRVLSTAVYDSLTPVRRSQPLLVTPGTAYVVVTIQCRCPVGRLAAPQSWVVDDQWREWDSNNLLDDFRETAHGVGPYELGEAEAAVDGVTTVTRVVPVALGATGLRPAIGRSYPTFLVTP